MIWTMISYSILWYNSKFKQNDDIIAVQPSTGRWCWEGKMRDLRSCQWLRRSDRASGGLRVTGRCLLPVRWRRRAGVPATRNPGPGPGGSARDCHLDGRGMTRSLGVAWDGTVTVTSYQCWYQVFKLARTHWQTESTPPSSFHQQIQITLLAMIGYYCVPIIANNED